MSEDHHRYAVAICVVLSMLQITDYRLQNGPNVVVIVTVFVAAAVV
jgi:hypothetical protein